MIETLQLLGTIGGLMFLALVVAVICLAFVCLVLGYIGTRAREDVNWYEATHGRKRDE
jgi:uncharacterized membrane protein